MFWVSHKTSVLYPRSGLVSQKEKKIKILRREKQEEGEELRTFQKSLHANLAIGINARAVLTRPAEARASLREQTAPMF